MAFSDATIEDVWAVQDGAELLVTWKTSSPSGTPFQIYEAGPDGAIKFVWHGLATKAVIPYPPKGLNRLWVGAVGTAEELTDFSATLTTGWQDRVQLSWQGGTYEAPDIAGFNVYQSSAAGQPVSYSSPVASVAEYGGGVITDGAGLGGAGLGGAGEANAFYVWISSRLAGGVWTFGVKPYDAVGNEGTTTEVSATIAAPPYPPGRNAAGKRLTYTYNPSTRVATLNWLAPGL